MGTAKYALDIVGFGNVDSVGNVKTTSLIKIEEDHSMSLELIARIIKPQIA
ncbi:MAG: hypothetical protein UT06_C0004G0001, partial [Candidatus Woesebacteria bacterium GW2011_GWA1_38_8]